MARVVELEDGRLYFECPGCGQSHAVPLSEAPGEPGWNWNGDADAPSLVPGCRARWQDDDGADRVCHFEIEAGWIRFGDGSDHDHAGQCLELPELVLDAAGQTLH